MMKRNFTSGSERMRKLAYAEIERTRSKTKGFTIIESLVAISILLVAIAGAGSAIQTGISSYIFSKDQIIAFYLAQEGFEQVRNYRDENVLNGRFWLAGAVPSVPYYVDATQNAFTLCPGTCPFIKQDQESGAYGHNASWDITTIFRIEIRLEQINDHEVAIYVTIHWNKGATARQFAARENIFNWQ